MNFRPLVRNAGKELLQRLLSPGRFLWRLPFGTNAIALTFDDGPHPAHTVAILDLLASTGVKATFFLIGEKVLQYPDLVRRIAADGHSIGGHTCSHTEIVGLSAADLEEELTRCRKVIRDACGIDSRLFRPPRGRTDFGSIRKVCLLGYCLVHWSKTYSDYKCDGVVQLAARLTSSPPVARDILLFHDHNPDTVAVLTHRIPEWKSAGIAFVAL